MMLPLTPTDIVIAARVHLHDFVPLLKAVTFLLFSLVFLTSCANDRGPSEPEQKPGIFETPDVDSLH